MTSVKSDGYKKNYEQHIDDILTYVTLCDPDKQSQIDPRTSFNPALLKRIEPFTDEMCQKDINPERGFFNDVLARDLGAPLNISLLKTYSGEEDADKYKYHAIQIRKVMDVRELRGQVTKLHPNIYNFRSGFPVVTARQLLKEAETLAEKKDRSAEENTRLKDLLNASHQEIDMAQALGYGTKKDFDLFYKELSQIEDKTSDGKSGMGFFEKIKSSMTAMFDESQQGSTEEKTSTMNN